MPLLELIEKQLGPEQKLEVKGVLLAVDALHKSQSELIPEIKNYTTNKVNSYTSGLLWVYQYLGGVCTDYDFNYQYQGPPSAAQMMKTEGKTKPLASKATPLTAIEALLSCIPSWVINILQH